MNGHVSLPVPPDVALIPLSDPKPLGVILLVEDEPLVRLVAADILMEAHFRVIEAADAEEALTVLRADVDVDVVLSDVEMPPGMNGYELAWQIHRDWPWMGILMSSGREWPRANDLPPGAAFLAKPYSYATLLSHVMAAAEKAQAARAVARPRSITEGGADDPAPPVPKTA
jgi:DNA-binding NtrC family response regulator